VVSVTDAYGRILGFLDRSRCFFLLSSYSVVLARLRGPDHGDLWWTKWHLRKFSPSTSVSPANHSTDCFTFIIHPSSGAGTIGLIVDDVPCGLSLTAPQGLSLTAPQERK
jgi:hypothetical protein